MVSQGEFMELFGQFKGLRHRQFGRRDTFGASKLLVETPMRVKDAPLTLRRKLRTSFALSYQLLRLISICGLAAVSMAFRANGGLAFIASAINQIEPLNTRNYTESLISVCFRAFRG